MKNHSTVILLLFLFLMSKASFSQNVAINADGSQPHTSAILDLQAIDKGLLIPRLDGEQRDAIAEPAPGLLIYQTGYNGGFRYYDGANWRTIERPFVRAASDIDGNIYDIVMIGDQHWFAENLKVTHFRNGDPIPFINTTETWAETNEAALTAYNGMPDTYVSDFGRLYNAFAVNDSRGLCPEGWKVPDPDDWQDLAEFLGIHAGGQLKALNGWELPNEGATNASGFSAMAAGQRAADGLFGKLRYHAIFWSKTDGRANNQVALLNHGSSEVYIETRPSGQGLSVRCIKVKP